MFINNTKTTNKAYSIAIAWNNEQEYYGISKIIQLFRWMKINVVFEPIDVAGINYKKNMKYGIDEHNLTHLKQTNCFIHTGFDYSYFNKKTHFDIDTYLDFALNNYFIVCFNKKTFWTQKTKFLIKSQSYIDNIGEIEKQQSQIVYNLTHTEYTASDDNANNCSQYAFFISHGAKYSIFCLNKIDDNSIKDFTVMLFKYFGLYKQAEFLNNFSKIDLAIDNIKHANQNKLSFTHIQNMHSLPIMSYTNIDTINNIYLDKQTNKLTGIFKICDLVTKIKEKKITLPEDYELYQIISNGIEYYPNINFWEKEAINPVVILHQIGSEEF